MSKRDKDRERWVTDTQLYQRIAGVPQTSREELETQFDAMKRKEHRCDPTDHANQ